MFWYDGQLIEGDRLELDIFDPGLLYGATIFTTLRIYGNSLSHPLTHWQAHCDRLAFSAQTFGWQQPHWERIRQGAEALQSHYGVLRVALFADGREWIVGRFLPQNLAQRQQRGITGWLADPSLGRSLATHKTGNYLGAWLAQQQAHKEGAQEAILSDAQGHWLETSTGNLWGWYDQCWWTPILGEILPGIVRTQLVQWFTQRQIPLQQTQWSRELVSKMEAIAYTNSVVEVVPFHTIMAQSSYSLNPAHPALQTLRAYFEAP